MDGQKKVGEAGATLSALDGSLPVFYLLFVERKLKMAQEAQGQTHGCRAGRGSRRVAEDMPVKPRNLDPVLQFHKAVRARRKKSQK